MCLESIRQNSERKRTAEVQRGNEKLLNISFWVAQIVVREREREWKGKLLARRRSKNKSKIKYIFLTFC